MKTLNPHSVMIDGTANFDIAAWRSRTPVGVHLWQALRFCGYQFRPAKADKLAVDCGFSEDDGRIRDAC
jgi:hypothetical protein